MHVAKNTHLLFLLYALCSLFLFLLDKRGNLQFVKIFSQKFTLPVEEKLYETRKVLFSPLGFFESKKILQEKITKLEEEKATLSFQVAQLGKLKEENEAARRLLSAGTPSPWRFAIGRVVSQQAGRLVVISDHTPSLGEAVVVGSEQAVLVGNVISSLGQRSEVLLPTSDGSKIPVVVRGVAGERHASGMLVGKGEKMTLEQVLPGETLDDGDLVLTSGDYLPPELLIGYVEKVSKTASWQEASVEWAIKSEGQNVVFFVTKF